MKTFFDYLQTISHINHMGNGSKIEWLFYCGMLFSSTDKWWGDFKQRHLPHEGIDICWYRSNQKEEINCFDTSTQIPAMANGTLLNICDDFLGKTLVVEHKPAIDSKYRIIFTYSHVLPEANLKDRQQIRKDQIIATVCDTNKNPSLPPHLHFSCFEIAHDTPKHKLTWNLFSDRKKVKMIHPVFL